MSYCRGKTMIACHRYSKRPSKIVTTPEESPLGLRECQHLKNYILNSDTHTTSSYSLLKGSPTEKIPISELTSAIARPFDSSSFDHIGFHSRTQPEYRNFNQRIHQTFSSIDFPSSPPLRRLYCPE